MKRVILFGVLLAALVASVQAQYAHVTIRQIQEVPLDSLLIADTLKGFGNNTVQPRWTLQTSPLMGDTVTVTGLCVVPPKVITYTAGGWTMILYDTSTVNEWGGVLVRGNAPADTLQLLADGFLNVAAGDVITMTGLISEFPLGLGFSLTQFQPIAGKPINIVGSGTVPQPIVKEISDFYKGIFPGGQIQFSTGEPFEGLLVELHNLTIDAQVNPTRGTFSAVDDQGNEISEYDLSHFFTLGHGGNLLFGPDSNWTRIYDNIGNGVRIDTLRGIITTSSGQEGPRGYRIAPLYPGDIVFGAVAPVLSTHRRNPVVVPSDSAARISVVAQRRPLGAPLDSVTLFYSLNSGPWQTLPMSLSDTTFKASIPQEPENTMVRYFIKAVDSAGQSTMLANSSVDPYASYATDSSKGFFFYTVLNRPLTIHDVQYTPYLNGRSPYIGAVATLSGIVTADTAHISISPLTNGGTSSWYMQTGSEPWSGIWLQTTDTTVQAQLAALRNGDSVMVTGTVLEDFDVTTLGNITAPVVVVSSGNPEPSPVVLTTGAFAGGNGSPEAEPYEGMLAQFHNVTVTNVNPTFSDPTEFTVDDGSGGMLIHRDGRNSYSNVEADSAALGKTILRVGNTIGSLTGIVYFSFKSYKIVPRTDADYVDVVLSVAPEPKGVATVYRLDQNYPNPFNPATIIDYAVPASGYVSLKVYNLLGQEVRVLVAGAQAAGRYSVHFDGGTLPSGVYFYRLQSGPFTEVRKMLLLK